MSRERRVMWKALLLVTSLLGSMAGGGCGRAERDGDALAGAGQAGSPVNEAGTSSNDDAGAAPNFSGDAGADAGSSCPASSLACGGVCVDPKFDPRHCGRCDMVCPIGELCSAGRCDLACLGGSTHCGARCVDTDTDPAHCGNCDTACSAGQVCSNGKCGLVCSGGTTRCGDACVDLRFDPGHCGSCESACSANRVCSNGVCNAQCGDGKLACDGSCIDAAIDPENCGSCGNVCPAGQLCSAGHCGNSCVNAVTCGNACVDLLSDSANCGGCGKACSASQTCVNGVCGLHCELSAQTQCGAACSNLTTDAKNCGSCFTTCSADKHCTGGSCVCAESMTVCQGACIDVKTNDANCGACGAACGTNEACSNGTCNCKAGTTRCGAACVDTSIHSLNCGACGSVCASGKVCTAGACAAPTSDWPTFQYDVAHSGNNTAETGKPPAKLSWSRKLAAGSHAPVIAGGRLFVTGRSYFADTSPLNVLNVSDGSDLWSYNFGAVSRLGAPSAFSGAVYVANGKTISGNNGFLWSLDAATGTTNWSAPLNCQWEEYWAPIRVSDVVYTNGGYYGGLYGIAAADGAQKFFQSLDQYDTWSPGYFSNHVFTFIAGNFRAHDPSTGVVTGTLALDWNWAGYSMGTAPVFNASQGFVIAPPNLVAIDPTTNKASWTANGSYTGTPAVAGDSVYGISAGNLIVRDAKTGALSWTFVGDTALKYPPVLANGFVYVASDTNWYAVDLTSHAQVAHDSIGGWLAIGSGRLIVASSDGTLTAYLLTY